MVPNSRLREEQAWAPSGGPAAIALQARGERGPHGWLGGCGIDASQVPGVCPLAPELCLGSAGHPRCNPGLTTPPLPQRNHSAHTASHSPCPQFFPAHGLCGGRNAVLSPCAMKGRSPGGLGGRGTWYPRSEPPLLSSTRTCPKALFWVLPAEPSLASTPPRLWHHTWEGSAPWGSTSPSCDRPHCCPRSGGGTRSGGDDRAWGGDRIQAGDGIQGR